MKLSVARKESHKNFKLSPDHPAKNQSLYNNFEEFWQRYLQEHQHPLNRRLHFVGTNIALILLTLAIFSRSLSLALAGVLSGYAFAWVGHFFVEKNRPLTFKYPWMSLKADFKAFGQTWKSFLFSKKPSN